MSNSFTEDIPLALSLEVQTAMRLCEDVNTPRSLCVYLLLKYRQWQDYLDLQIDPNDYESTGNFADDYLVTEVMRKSPNIPINVDKRAEAISSFLDSELLCFFTNERVKREECTYGREIRRNISRILGPLTRKSLQEIVSSFSHGPGATQSLRGRGSTPSDKFRKTVSMTVELYPYYKSIVGELWHSANSLTKDVVYGSKFTTVPKSAKTDRGICCEPTLNMYVQKGIGSYIRRRLRRFGLDLSTQQDRNRELARTAIDRRLATIDLSMASDSLAYYVVLSYFPPEWVELLTLCRSHRTSLDGEWHELEKFSSMGNGYTFELESLIFYAVCMSIVPRSEFDAGNVAVYGDDIIIPSVYSSAVIETLSFLGFNVNESKSFLAGNFYESCGSDWYKGVNVRPFYLKGKKDAVPYQVQIANKLRLYAYARCFSRASDPRFRRTWIWLLKQCPPMWRKARVPIHFGDTGIISSKMEARPRVLRDGHEGFVVKYVKFTPVYRRQQDIYPYLASLAHGGWTDFSLGREPRKGYLGKPQLRKSRCPTWTDSLEWLD